MTFSKREPVLVLVFSIITCGIYYLYWIYKVSEELGTYLQNDNNPILELILCFFCAPYTIYWSYKTGQQIFVAQDRAGLPRPQDNAIVYLILCLFGLGPIAALIIQSTLNEINE